MTLTVDRGLDLARVLAAAERLAGRALTTPLLPWHGQHVKAECLQRSGSFKLRGATNAVLCRAADGAEGVVTWSSGNHGRAVAMAAVASGLPAVVLIPSDAPDVKRRAVEDAGAEVATYDRRTDDRAVLGRALADQRGFAVIAASDDPDVVAGQGTVALEVLAQLDQPLERLVVPVGGGGLMAGCAVVLSALSPTTQLLAVEPAASPDFHLSRQLGRRVTQVPGRSVADGCLLSTTSQLAADTARAFGVSTALCEDVEVERAMRWAALDLKLVLEGSGAVALTQLDPGGTGTVAVATGGNVSTEVLRRVLR